jgi:subtilisin family serine protease
MDKCNADLLLEIERWKFDREQLVADGASQEALDELDAKVVDLFVTFAGDPAALEDSAFTLSFYDGTDATGSIALRDMDELRAIEGVARISLAPRVAPHLNLSIPAMKADKVRSNAPPYKSSSGPRAYTGKGVLIGVIDDSIYEQHGTFLRPDPDPKVRKTRIVAIWDHMGRANPARGLGPPPPFKQGVLWTESEINKVLAGGATAAGEIRVSSLIGHGTHVAGIAAGNGRQHEAQVPPFTLVGVAPEADIAFTNAIQYEQSGASVADAVQFIFALAAARNQPCVINMSFGTHEGARDGSSVLERAIDRALTGPDGQPLPGRAVVVAAGNEAEQRRHSRKKIAAGGKLTFRMRVAEVPFPGWPALKPRPAWDDDSIHVLSYDKIYIWYAGAASIEIRITPPGGPPDPPTFVGRGEVKTSRKVGVVVAEFPDPASGKNYISITLSGPVMTGEWMLELREVAGVETPVDIWVDRNGDDMINPVFVDGDNIADNTVTCPSTAKHVIAVGNYYAADNPPPANSFAGQIYHSSSRGIDSTYGASDAEVRPHVAAPGCRILAANNTFWADEKKVLELLKLRFGNASIQYHAMLTGTSMSAPHVTGVVALMFEKNPTLTGPQVRSILQSTASRNIPGFVGFPNRHWGFGKVDVEAALAATPSP